MTWDQVTDVPSSRPAAEHRSWWRRHILAVVVLVALVVVVAVLATGGDSRPEEPGEQFGAPASRVRGPGTRLWLDLEPDDGAVRDGWPLPMIARGDEVCFGFGRVDFAPPTRPTVARCVDADEIPELPTNGIVSLVVIRAGLDTWHLLATGGDIDSVEISAVAGAPLDGGRIHTDRDLVALRLPASTDLSELSWIIGRKRVVCTPRPGSTESGELCPPDDGTATG